MNNINGFYKVAEDGFTYVTAVFYNPNTQEEFNKLIYDYDDYRVEYDAGVYYSLPIDKNVRRQWLHKHGVIQNGDIVIIYKGRKMVGEIKTVKYEYTYVVEGTYGHGAVKYLVFTDGTKCIKDNCKLYEEK